MLQAFNPHYTLNPYLIIFGLLGKGLYLARKSDLEPGPSALWKGWKRLFDLAEGWRLAHVPHICG